MPVILKINCRIEEVPTIGGFLRASLGTDQVAIAAVYPDFDAAYVTNMDTQLNAVIAVVLPKTLTSELKVITLRIYTNMALLAPMMAIIEGYIKRAVGLTIAPGDFGVKQVRQAYAKGDVEKLANNALPYLIGNLGNATNMAALLLKGYTAAQHNALKDIQIALGKDNTAQNQKLNDRSDLVEANYGLLNDFWVICTDVGDAGKRVFRKTSKADDYTIEVLKRRIRQEQLKTKVNGKATAAGVPVNKAKMVLTPVLGGRKRTTKTKADGTYEFKGLAAGDYILTVTADGLASQSVAVTVVTKQTEVVNFLLVP